VQINANKQILVRPHFEIVKILDGDGMIVYDYLELMHQR